MQAQNALAKSVRAKHATAAHPAVAAHRASALHLATVKLMRATLKWVALFFKNKFLITEG